MNLEEKRKRFQAWLKNFIEQHEIEPVKEIPPDSIIVCTPVEEWHESGNDVWKLDANKSYKRNVFCDGDCKRQMVMSTRMFRLWLIQANKVMCVKCATKYAEKESE